MENELQVEKVNSIQTECVGYDSLLTVTEWSNKDGVDIQLTSRNGGIQHLSISYLEFTKLNELVEKLGSL